MARIFIGNIKGPKGDTGARGATGPQGATGATGPMPPLTNNALATTPGVSALDAVMGKTLDEKIGGVISDLDNITSANTLLYTFKYLPPSFLDNPNSHFKVSGWTAVPYLSLSNTATGAGWGVFMIIIMALPWDDNL